MYSIGLKRLQCVNYTRITLVRQKKTPVCNYPKQSAVISFYQSNPKQTDLRRLNDLSIQIFRLHR